MKRRMVYHVDVPELIPSAGSANLVFKSKVHDESQSDPVTEENVSLFIPYPVLESIGHVIPQILQDLRGAGGHKVFGAQEVQPAIPSPRRLQDPRRLANGDRWPDMFRGVPEILGASFGDILVELEGVAMDFHLRAVNLDGTVSEGKLENVIMTYTGIKAWAEGLPGGIRSLAEEGASHGLLEPATKALPAWNEGPRSPALDECLISTAFEIRSVISDLGAMLVRLETLNVVYDQERPAAAHYLWSIDALKSFAEALPKVERKMQQKGFTAKTLQ